MRARPDGADDRQVTVAPTRETITVTGGTVFGATSVLKLACTRGAGEAGDTVRKLSAG